MTSDKQVLLDEDLHTKLKLRATKNKRSIKDELSEILKDVFKE